MKKILYISLVDWYWIKQRPQHFAQILSKNENNVTYFCIRGWRNNSNCVNVHSLKDKTINLSCFSVGKSLKVVRKKICPKQDKIKIIKKINKAIIRKYLRKLEKNNNYDIVIFTHPVQYSYIYPKLLENKTVIYDCMDNYKEFNGLNKKEIVENEQKILKLADYVITSSENLRRKLIYNAPEIKNKIYVINNGVDEQIFNVNNIKTENEVNIFKNNKNKKVGYIGTISTWLDMECIKETAYKYKNIDFYIVGPIDKGVDISKIQNIENIIFTGTQPYYSIPNILSKFDVAIMPFKVTELIKSVNPVKIYEYLSMGKAVIASKYAETEKIGKHIYIYSTIEEFQQCLEKAINEKNDMFQQRVNFAKQNTWEKRVKQFLDILEL